MGFEVFGVGVPEMVIIAMVALIFLGPERLPEVARTLGGWVREIRSMSADAASVWQETLGVGETIRDSIRLDGPPRAAAPGSEPAISVPYTPAPQAQLPPPPLPSPISSADLLEYPAPYAEPPAPPAPAGDALEYPAPFADK
jgi:sec-independent protein translocase protein TatB